MTSSKVEHGLSVMLLLPLALAFGLMGNAFGLATEDKGNEPLLEANYQEWKGKGIMPVINHKSRVYHTWCNGNEHFYYHGDAEALNDILGKFATVKTDVREVMFERGPAEATTFQEERVPYHWQLHLLTGIAAALVRRGEQVAGKNKNNPTMTVFLGNGNIEFEKIQIPKGITVIDKTLALEDLVKQIGVKVLANAAYSTFRASKVEPKYIPSELWTDLIRKLKPIRVYKHRVNIVVVLKESDEVEEGLYIQIPVSSYIPRSGDDDFIFTNIDGLVYKFKRKNRN